MTNTPKITYTKQETKEDRDGEIIDSAFAEIYEDFAPLPTPISPIYAKCSSTIVVAKNSTNKFDKILTPPNIFQFTK
jgi:hypothetical protein